MAISARTWIDVTGALIDAVSAEWGGLVVPTVPKPRPDEFVVIQRLGGKDDGVVDRATMGIDCWSGQQGDSIVPVTTLATTIREILRQAPATAAGGGLSYIAIESFGYLPDAVSGCPRCIITATVTAKPLTGS